ncbi:T9SS type A sorting domain-containing protein, partial [bacterium]|nr:T9SS type A sorting domain-containing protein [bacterium]
IEIYDLLGNPIWSEVVPRSGPAEMVWTPDKSIGSGVYLVRARSGRQSATKKIIYLK